MTATTSWGNWWWITMPDEEMDEAVGQMMAGRFSGDDDDENGKEPEKPEVRPELEPEPQIERPDDAAPSLPAAGAPETPVREWKQYAMLLPPSYHSELNRWFKRLNAERVLDDQEEIDKNAEFHYAIVGYVLDNMDESDLAKYMP